MTAIDSSCVSLPTKLAGTREIFTREPMRSTVNPKRDIVPRSDPFINHPIGNRNTVHPHAL